MNKNKDENNLLFRLFDGFIYGYSLFIFFWLQNMQLLSELNKKTKQNNKERIDRRRLDNEYFKKK